METNLLLTIGIIEITYGVFLTIVLFKLLKVWESYFDECEK